MSRSRRSAAAAVAAPGSPRRFKPMPPRSSRYTPPKGAEAEEKLGLIVGQAEDLDPQAKADAEMIKWAATYGPQWQPQPFQYQVFAGTIGTERAIFLRLETAVGRL